MDKRTAEFVKMLEARLERARDVIATFAKKLCEDPTVAMEWSEGAFQAAAHLQIFGDIHRVLSAKDTKATLQSVRDYAAREMQRGAGWGWRSTSVVSNVFADARTRAWAEVVEWADSYLAMRV